MGCDTTGSRGISSPVGRVMEAWKQSRTEFRSNSSSHTFTSGTAAKTQQGKGVVHSEATQQGGKVLHPVMSRLSVFKYHSKVKKIMTCRFVTPTLHTHREIVSIPHRMFLHSVLRFINESVLFFFPY